MKAKLKGVIKPMGSLRNGKVVLDIGSVLEMEEHAKLRKKIKGKNNYV
jgi:hypothetical protein